MREGQLLLETVPGSLPLPSDCFAALRFDDGSSVGSLTRCTATEANCFKDVPLNGAVCKVDLFKYVGSISLGLREPGHFVEASVQWPGLADGEVLTLRLSISAGPPAEELPHRPSAVLEPYEPPAVAGTGISGPRPPPLDTSPAALAPTPAQPPAQVVEVVQRNYTRTQSPAERTPKSHREREATASYRPIVLNNCNQIIPFLYLGGVDAATDTEALVQQGIRAVCCCVRELEFPEKEFNTQLSYYRVDVEDISREPIELFFPEATEFIHSWVSRELPVLVHCRAGVSRSASVVIAYLIAYGGYSLHDAFFLARSHRPIVTPNIGFMEKLGEFEESIRGTEPTIDINKYVGWYTMPERPAVPDLRPD